MKKRPVLNTICTSLVLALAAGSGAAQSIPLGCYHRAYTDAHLASHPAQGVAEIWIIFDDAQQGDLNRYFTVTARMTDQGQAARDRVQRMVLQEAGICYESEGACFVECDGGGFEIVSHDGQTLMIETDYTRIARGGCGGGGDAEAFSSLAEIPGQSTRYRLNRVADMHCPRL